jgi:hypothetical protein
VGTDYRGGRLRCVDAINTFRVIAGRFTLFRVVSRSQIQYFRSSRRFMRLVRFPAAPLRRCWSGPQVLASFFLLNIRRQARLYDDWAKQAGDHPALQAGPMMAANAVEETQQWHRYAGRE